MSSDSHPILKELSKQLPESTRTLQYIQENKGLETIAQQSRREFACLGNLEGTLKDGQTCVAVLQESGYAEWLKDSDEEDRLRLLGTLRMIVEFTEDMEED